MDNNSEGTKKDRGSRRKAGQLPAPLVFLIERARHAISDRILRLPELCKKTGRAPSTTWKDVHERTFPPPVRLGPRAVGWRESEVDAWLEARSFATRCADNPFDMKDFIDELISSKGNISSIATNRLPPTAVSPEGRSPFLSSATSQSVEADQ